ncbi:MAG: 6,7-dimethyl-8-ribityllumazine synthase [Paramuribaculum sp.]|nr:6,7-dimethyl-8-ribityllumazine synthase [Paramuribaculum sp.]
MSIFKFTLEIGSKVKDSKVAIVQAKWNGHITDRLKDGAVKILKGHGLDDDSIEVYEVPGAVELTYAAKKIADEAEVDAIIVLGCVIKGDTPHFDYVCQSVTQGVTLLNSKGKVPVIFGLLTVESEQQALDRVGGPAGHKGEEAAETALSMIEFAKSF